MIDVRGQAVTSHDRLYLASDVPVLLVWGDKDPMVPVTHAARAAEALPHAQLSIVPKSGHMPHRSAPESLAAAVSAVGAAAQPAAPDPSLTRAKLIAGPHPSVTKSISLSTALSRGTSTSA